MDYPRVGISRAHYSAGTQLQQEPDSPRPQETGDPEWGGTQEMIHDEAVLSLACGAMMLSETPDFILSALII